MRHVILPLVAVVLVGCGAAQEATPPPADGSLAAAPAHSPMSDDAAHQGAMADTQPRHDTGLNTEIHLSDNVRNAWRAIEVRVVDTTTGKADEVEVPIGATVALGSSGLSLTAEAFIPDFVMDSSGITSRSDTPDNPAAKVTIAEKGKDPYIGWLFAALPDIHPFPHDRYQVLLVEGVPAG